MITTTYNYKKPENGDVGQPIFDALNGNTDLVIAHTHNGTNSAAVLASSLSKGSVNLNSASWVVTPDGNGYYQGVSLPGAYTLANCSMRFRIRTGGAIYTPIFPTVVPVNATSFNVIVNDNTLDLEVLFI